MNYHPSVQVPYSLPSHGGHYNGAPVQVVPSMNGPMLNMAQPVPMGYPQYPAYGYPSLGNRIRHFFGMAPSNIRYRSEYGTWGFMGYSRRQRYINAQTGMEVDRDGRLVFRV